MADAYRITADEMTKIGTHVRMMRDWLNSSVRTGQCTEECAFPTSLRLGTILATLGDIQIRGAEPVEVVPIAYAPGD